MSIPAPQQQAQRAHAALQAGDRKTAEHIMSAALAQYPDHADLQNSAGDLFQRLGEAGRAVRCFALAGKLAPERMDIAINHAIALSGLQRYGEALRILARFEENGRTSALYASTRAANERGVGRKAAAAQWYDVALALEPARIKALHGRARVALERGEPSALDRFDLALSVNQSDADLWLGKAQALDVLGDVPAAREIAEALVEQAPHWGEALRFLAQLRLAAGEPDFASHYETAATKVPGDPAIYTEWGEVLEGLDYHQDAAEVARRGFAQFPSIERFRLLEATYAGSGGDIERAERIFSNITQDDPERWLQEARHRIRCGGHQHADNLLGKVLEAQPSNIAAWALRGVVWRLLSDPRADWLHGQAELVQLVPLQDAGSVLPPSIPVLHHLHEASPLPLGQSLRGGTQTRGHLFDRTEPDLAALKQAIEATLAQFRGSLPGADETHPLLRYRDHPWRLAGSWSVRLNGGGDHHTSHIHPQGIVSSALYLELPDGPDPDPQAGWLEIGRPPPDLHLTLPPLRVIEPQVGHLALFPSTLYHGTRPFSGSSRMTVAFDVTLEQE